MKSPTVTYRAREEVGCPGAIAKGFTAGRDEQGYRDMDLLRQASL